MDSRLSKGTRDASYKRRTTITMHSSGYASMSFYYTQEAAGESNTKHEGQRRKSSSRSASVCFILGANHKQNIKLTSVYAAPRSWTTRMRVRSHASSGTDGYVYPKESVLGKASLVQGSRRRGRAG